MKVVRTIRDLPPATGSVGLVPTMGAFHDGHLSLLRAAAAENETAIASLFVNPAQFGPGEDLAAYPRDEERDARLAAAEGVDILFAPASGDVFPLGFDTTVAVSGITEILEGDPEHRGPPAAPADAHGEPEDPDECATTAVEGWTAKVPAG